MKNTIYLLLVLLSSSVASHAQLPDASTTNQDNKTTSTENFMDLQANVYGDIFGNMMDIDALKGIDDFMSLVNKMDASPELKEQLVSQYELYSNSLDPKKKEIVKVQFNELLVKAMNESKSTKKQIP